jgi:hypothetical protein
VNYYRKNKLIANPFQIPIPTHPDYAADIRGHHPVEFHPINKRKAKKPNEKRNKKTQQKKLIYGQPGKPDSIFFKIPVYKINQ